MSSKPRIVVMGAGGHGHVVLDVLRRQGLTEIVGFLDDREELHGTTSPEGVAILGGTDWGQLPPDTAEAFVVAIGDNSVRRSKYEKALKAGLTPWLAIHPSAIIADSAELGAGIQVVAGAIINPFARVGCNVILNTACTVDHNCRVGDHAFLGPGVHLGGEVEVGEMALVGLGAAILPGVKIGEGALVGAGAVVTRNVEPWTMVLGVPARRVRDLEPEAI